MGPKGFDLIAFDGDDTLWHNERSYRDGRNRFHRLLAAAGVSLTSDEIDAVVNRVETDNIRHFGYGVSSFALSLIETAIEITGGRIPGRDLRELIDVARTMLAEEIELFPEALGTLQTLSTDYPLMLVTKGDLLHQTSKVERSGLQLYFSHVEVVSHKTPEVYARILRRYGVNPARFLMIGNSLRSDVLPVVALGARAVHIPAALDWSHEHADPPEEARCRIFAAVSLADVIPLVESLSAGVVQVHSSTPGPRA